MILKRYVTRRIRFVYSFGPSKTALQAACCRLEGAEDGLGSTKNDVQKILVNFALPEVQWNELTYIREIETTLFYKNRVVHAGKFRHSLYTAKVGCGNKRRKGSKHQSSEEG